MVHITTFGILLAIIFSAVSLAFSIVIKKPQSHQVTTWVSLVIAGLGSFLLEIIIWRYGHMAQSVIPTQTFEKIIFFSNIWAVIGTLLITVSMPKLSRMLTGQPENYYWKFFEIGIPVLALLVGTFFILGIGGSYSVTLLQTLLFGSVIISFLMIAFMGPDKSRSGGNKLLKRIVVISALFLPLVILEAIGILVHPLLDDLPISLFVSGLCVVFLLQVRKLNANPTYLKSGCISDHFINHFGITKREGEIVVLVLDGASNAIIAKQLFISEKTVENHMTNILRKTETKNRLHLFRLIHSSSD